MKLEWLFLTIAPCDAAEPWQLGFQDAATPMMQGIIDLHHDIFFFLILILVFVSRILVRALWHFHYQKNPIPQRIVHGTTIEILRTIFPSIIPMFIAIPSFALLYSMDEVVVDPAITIKAIGHQWYRTYEYSDYNSSDEQSLTFDSYTIPEDDLELGQSRLLEVDNRVVVPAKTHLRIIVTPADVPHSWAVPSLGVKCDAVPGRLNQISISVQREGVYYGQCSEICGTNHAFTPIVVEAVPRKDYGSRVSNQLIPQTGGVGLGGRALLIPSPVERRLVCTLSKGCDLELRLAPPAPESGASEAAPGQAELGETSQTNSLRAEVAALRKELHLPASSSSPSSERAFTGIPLVGNLSKQEQDCCAQLVSFEKRFIKKASLMLKSLEYTADEMDVKGVVSAFIENVDPDLYDFYLLSIINKESPIFLNFLQDWEDYHYPRGFPNPPRSRF
nr:cytochrome c oxidase subunit 2 [Pterodon emarginatus]